MSGTTSDINGKMSVLFTSDTNNLDIETHCYSIGIVGNNCESPEINETCISKKHSTFCFDNENNVRIGEEAQIFNNATNVDLDYSFLLNTNNLQENLDRFAQNHVRINNQIVLLLENETSVNFDNFPYEELASSEDEGQFRQAIENTGIVRYNELASLLIEQAQNQINFTTDNRDFALLKEETKQILISAAIDKAIIGNPIHWPPMEPGDTVEKRTCQQQFVKDKDRCNETLNIEFIGFAAAWIFGGPVGGGIAGIVVLAHHANCMKWAKEDLKDCLN